MFQAIGAIAFLFIATPAAAAGQDVLPGPVPATVVRVIDGDTVAVDAAIWPGLKQRTMVRVRGIDTPEKRSKCPTEEGRDHEQALALKASDLTSSMVAQGDTVGLVLVGQDKYGGRVVADIVLADGTRLSERLVRAGLARPYDGGAKASWCD